jgi:hypothetical protein
MSLFDGQFVYGGGDYVVGPATAINLHLMVFDGTTGKLCKDIGYAITELLLLAGRSGGQIIRGGVDANDNLTLDSTDHATKGDVLIQPTGGDVGIGTPTPQGKLDINAGSGNKAIVLDGANNRYVDILNGAYKEFRILSYDDNGALSFGIRQNGRLYFAGTSDGVNWSPLFTILGTGYTGLGSITTPTVGLHLPNAATSGEGLAYAWGTHSSRRWKTNIKTIHNPIEKILQLTGIEFDWKPENGGKHDIGLIAEDVGHVIPEVVNYEENGTDAKSVNYDRLVALLVEAIKEQQMQINDLRSKIDGVIV